MQMSSHSLLNVILIINSNCGDGKIAYIISSFLLFGSISTEMGNACSSVFYLILYVWQMCTYVHAYLFETGTSCASRLAGLPNFLGLSCLSFTSYDRELDYRLTLVHLLLGVLWGCEIKSSQLICKCFTHWPSEPLPQLHPILEEVKPRFIKTMWYVKRLFETKNKTQS